MLRRNSANAILALRQTSLCLVAEIRRSFLRRCCTLAPLPLFLTIIPVSLSQSHPSAQSQASESITLRVIVVRTAVDAQRVLDRLRKGEDFAVLAHTESVDPNAEDYGYVGKVDLSTLRPELGEAIRGKSPGEVTEPVKVPGGYAILKVLPPSEGSVGQGMGASRDASSKAKYDIPPMLQGK